MRNDSSPDDRPESETGAELLGAGELLWECIARLNRGETIDETALRKEHAAEAEEVLRQLEAFKDIGTTGTHAGACGLLGTLGDYTLRRQVGRGGMGVVYEAWENSMGRRVALKVLPAGVAADSRTFMRFMREAKTAGQLSHPNVVSVYAMGLKEQTPYYAMEFIEGETLAQALARLKDAGPTAATPFGATREEIAFYANLAKTFADVADGLQYAHAKRIIHRDIKPSNLIFDREGRLRILDFGVARMEGQESITVSGDLVGTVQYMSPEQAQVRKMPIDHRTDVYSLGATMYEMLTWRPPFKGKDHHDTLSQIIERDPVEPRKLNERVPRDLETIVLKCLRKEAVERYGTAEALGQDLRRFVRGDPIEARPQGGWEKLSRRVRWHRGKIIGAVIIAVALAASGFSVWMQQARMRDAMRVLHDSEVRKAAMELYLGQLTLLGSELDRLGDNLFIFKAHKFERGIPGVSHILAQLEAAADAVPERPDAPYYLSQLYRLLGDTDAAAREAARALERDPDFVPAEVLARELSTGVFPLDDPSLQALRTRFLGHGGSERWQEPWLLAYQHVGAGRWAAAAEAYERLLLFREIQKAEPYVGYAVESLIGRGLARLRADDFEGAIRDFSAARGIWPGFPEAGLMLGSAYYKAGKTGEAERVFLELRATCSDEDTRTKVASWIVGVYGTLGDGEKASEWSDRITGWARNRLNCVYHFFGNRFEECRDEALLVLDKSPDDLVALVSLGWARLEMQWDRYGPRWDKERRDLLEFARENHRRYPNHPHVTCILAFALHVNGLRDEAVKTAESAIGLQLRRRERPIVGPRILGTILRMQGDLERARDVFETYFGTRSSDGRLRFQPGQMLEAEGSYEEALEEYRAHVQGGTSSAYPYGLLAGILNRLGHYEEAAENAKAAVERLPRNSSGYEQLAYALWKLGRPDEALEVVDVGLEKLPGRIRLLLVRGWILESLGNVEHAGKAYADTLNLNVEYEEAHEALRDLLRQNERLVLLPEVIEVRTAIEKRVESGRADRFLLDTLSLISELSRGSDRGEAAKR